MGESITPDETQFTRTELTASATRDATYTASYRGHWLMQISVNTWDAAGFLDDKVPNGTMAEDAERWQYVRLVPRTIAHTDFIQAAIT